jgi:transposase
VRAPARGSVEEKIKGLMDVRGIGLVGGQKLLHEVFYRSFNNRREVGSFLGLVNSPYDSGSTRRDQGISKAGNPRVRSLAVELAWLWLRFQPDSELSRWFRARVGSLKGRIRRIAIVALARKLMIALWRYVTTGLVPTGAVVRQSA